jgi:hypothetical protein
VGVCAWESSRGLARRRALPFRGSWRLAASALPTIAADDDGRTAVIGQSDLNGRVRHSGCYRTSQRPRYMMLPERLSSVGHNPYLRAIILRFKL